MHQKWPSGHINGQIVDLLRRKELDEALDVRTLLEPDLNALSNGANCSFQTLKLALFAQCVSVL